MPSECYAAGTRGSMQDGLTIQFRMNCHAGRAGSVVTLATIPARKLIQQGFAQIYGQQQVARPAVVEENYLYRVTAICPTYNRRKYIPTAISDFLAQTFTDSELLIVDDSDESVVDLVPDNPRIRYIRLSGARTSLGEKRNMCCENARGKYIVHWDDDDRHFQGLIADQITQLEASGKQVLTYYNILYYNEETQVVCRCFPNKLLRALHGATFCYRKSWWQQHPFKHTNAGEDTEFGTVANSHGQLVLTDAGKHIVTRAHGKNENKDGRGNTCSTAMYMGTPAIPKTTLAELPPEFFDPIAAPRELTAKDDVVVGVVKNYDWPALRPYAVSLSRTGFTGVKLLLVENITLSARNNLTQLGFTLVDFRTTPAAAIKEKQDYLEFGRTRFGIAIPFLRSHAARYIVWCDVRDLIFQVNPSVWLEKNLAPHRLIAAGECWHIKNEQYNDMWMKNTVSHVDYLRAREEEVCCSGTIAGDASTMLAVYARMQEVAHTAQPLASDQALWNVVLRESPFKDITRIPRMKEGWAATCSAFRTPGFKSYAANTDVLIDQQPVFDKAELLVREPETGVPFCIVHQYDRDTEWKRAIEEKYR